MSKNIVNIAQLEKEAFFMGCELGEFGTVHRLKDDVISTNILKYATRIHHVQGLYDQWREYQEGQVIKMATMHVYHPAHEVSKSDRVHCKNCYYFLESGGRRYGECDYEGNTKDGSDWFSVGIGHKRKPKFINRNMDCPWFLRKG